MTTMRLHMEMRGNVARELAHQLHRAIDTEVFECLGNATRTGTDDPDVLEEQADKFSTVARMLSTALYMLGHGTEHAVERAPDDGVALRASDVLPTADEVEARLLGKTLPPSYVKPDLSLPLPLANRIDAPADPLLYDPEVVKQWGPVGGLPVVVPCSAEGLLALTPMEAWACVQASHEAGEVALAKAQTKILVDAGVSPEDDAT